MKFSLVFLSLLVVVTPQAPAVVATTTLATTLASTVASTTAGAPCVDLAGNCAQLNLCTNGVYGPLMHKNCRKTCNFCDEPIPPTDTPITPTKAPITPCADQVTGNGPNSCSALAYLCKNPAYMPLMKKECTKTCGYC